MNVLHSKPLRGSLSCWLRFAKHWWSLTWIQSTIWKSQSNLKTRWVVFKPGPRAKLSKANYDFKSKEHAMYVPVFQNWFHYRNPKRSEASWSSLKFNKVPGMGRFLLGLKFHQTGGCGNITYAARNRIRSIATADTSHTSKTGSFYKVVLW